jgi:hypothetical protein
MGQKIAPSLKKCADFQQFFAVIQNDALVV